MLTRTRTTLLYKGLSDTKLSSVKLSVIYFVNILFMLIDLRVITL